MTFQRLLLLFVTIPLVELGIFLMLADVISLPVTLAIIIITGVIGAYLAKQQGGLAWRNFQQALAGGKLPHVEATDGILVLIAGVVLLTPGFLTDAIGFSLMLPPIRAMVRGRLAEQIKARMITGSTTSYSAAPPREASAAAGSDGLKPTKGRVIDVE